jgi:NADPH:quinone reductase-like Zn-dependent oxidoreductase
MDAAVLTEPGTPRFGAFADPVAADGAVVADVLAAGLNPVDLAMASGRFPIPLTLPSVAGREGVGVVDGRRVYFSGPVAPFGSMAERTLVDPAVLFAVPEELDTALAVALGIAGLAAWLPLAWAARLEPGESVLVLGATGTLGTIAVQVARLLGAGRVVAAGRDAAGLDRALRLGADAVVDLSDGDVDALAATMRDAAGGGVDVVVDPLWGPPALAALAAANPFARLVQIGNSAAPETTLAAGAFRQTSARIIGYTTRLVPIAEQRAAYEAMCAHAVAGALEVDVERIPLRDVEAAWARQAAFPHHKLVLEP